MGFEQRITTTACSLNLSTFRSLTLQAKYLINLYISFSGRKNFPDCDILVDGNNGFTADEFIKYLKGIEGIRLFWIEEHLGVPQQLKGLPAHWKI